MQQLTTTTTDTQSVCDSYISCYYIIISQQFTAKYETNSEMEKKLTCKAKDIPKSVKCESNGPHGEEQKWAK